MSKRRIEKFLLKYFESNNYSETLKTFQNEIKEENTETRILSFKIIKAPKITVDIEEKKKKSRKKEEVKIPKEFKRIAKRAGIPKDQFEFFYEHRESFNWEVFKPTGNERIHARPNCNFKSTVLSAKKNQSTTTSASPST